MCIDQPNQGRWNIGRLIHIWIFKIVGKKFEMLWTKRSLLINFNYMIRLHELGKLWNQWNKSVSINNNLILNHILQHIALGCQVIFRNKYTLSCNMTLWFFGVFGTYESLILRDLSD